MLLKYFYDKALAHASYMVGCQRAKVALVVDPGRDIDQYLETAKREGVKLSNGDMVGALHPVQLQHSEHMLSERLAKLLMDTMEVNNQGSMKMAQAIAIVKTKEPIMANRKDVEVRTRLEGLFSVPFAIAGRTLTVTRDPDNDKAQPVLTLT